MLASLAEAGSEDYVSVMGKPAEAVPGVARDGTQLMNECNCNNCNTLIPT